MTPQHILVLRSGAVGDFILTTPVLATLRQAYPNAFLTVAGHPARTILAEHLVDERLDIDNAGWAPYFSESGPSDQALSISRYDLIINYLPDKDGTLTRNLSNACRGQVISHSPHPPEDGSRHIIDHLLQGLAPLDLPLKREPNVAVSDAKRDAPFAILHPGSGSLSKNWPLDRYIDLGSRLSSQGPIAWSLGPAEDAICEQIERLEHDHTILSGMTLTDLGATIASAPVYVGNDTGITHLAAATGTPTVALFGPTDNRIWGPVGSIVRTLTGDAETPTEDRLNQISVDEVLNTVNQLISK